MPIRPYAVLGSVLLAASMWIWVQRIAIPHQQAESVALDVPRGNLSDLYPRWLGARELLLHGRDPYGKDITRDIQAGYYGRPLDPARPGDPKDRQAFAYPIYVVLLLAPSVALPFATVHGIFFWLFAILTGVSVLLWLQTLSWRIRPSTKVVWIVLTLSSFPAIQGLKLLQLTVLVAALLAAALSAVARRRFILAGVLLAFATIKPQLLFLPMLWLCIWTFGNWRQRQRLLWSFAVTMAILVIAGEILLPGWIHEFRAAMADYYRYTGGGRSVLDVILTPTWGRCLSAIATVLFLVFAWQARKADEGTPAFHWCLSLVLATTLLVIPMFAPYNQLLLLPALMLIVRSFSRLWEQSRLSRFFVGITGLSVLWSWVAAALLAIALLLLPGPTVERAWDLPFYTTFAIPLTIYGMVLAGKDVLSLLDATSPRTLQPNAASE